MALRTKLLITYIGLTLAGIALVSLFTSWEIKNYLDRRTEANLRTHVESFAALVASGELRSDELSEHEAALRKVARLLNLRLTFIRSDGRVVFDSDVPMDSLSGLENHLHRPEMEESRTGKTGVNRRLSASVGREFLYAASMVTRSGPNGSDTVYVRAALPYDEIKLLDRQVQIIVWAIGLLSLIVITLVSLRVSRQITRPILAIGATARAIRNGDLSLRIPVTGSDEIGMLAASINDMADKLSSDISQLKKLERVRSEFLGNVSHELRTPIFSLQGFLETLLDGAVDDPSVNRDFLEKAHRHASRLNALLTDLIEISRIESGEMKMSFRYLPLVDLMRETTEEMMAPAKQKGIQIAMDPGDCEKENVYGDRERLKQVLVNLLDNAIKYTDPGGRVIVRARRDGEQYCVVEVEDSGSGIPEEHHERIFERFYRVDKDRSREVGGTGLGLAIVKHIVEAHGGGIHVTSAVGKGSRFAFTVRR